MRDSLVVSVGMRPVKIVSTQATTRCLVPHTEACQCVDSVNVHGATSANALATTPPKGQSRVHLVLDPDERIQHHGSRLVQVEGVRLHLGLGRGLIGIPSVDVESLRLRILAGRGLLDGRRLALGDGLSRSIRHGLFGGLGDGVAGIDVGYGGEAARENCRPYGCRIALAVPHFTVEVPPGGFVCAYQCGSAPGG